MKTTIDLPPDLVREMKILAVHEGRKLKDVAADLLRRGLSGDNTKPKSAVRRDFLLSAPIGAPEMTPDRVRKILQDTP
jgi:plasmid stability protein